MIHTHTHTHTVAWTMHELSELMCIVDISGNILESILIVCSTAVLLRYLQASSKRQTVYTHTESATTQEKIPFHSTERRLSFRLLMSVFVWSMSLGMIILSISSGVLFLSITFIFWISWSDGKLHRTTDKKTRIWSCATLLLVLINLIIF